MRNFKTILCMALCLLLGCPACPARSAVSTGELVGVSPAILRQEAAGLLQLPGERYRIRHPAQRPDLEPAGDLFAPGERLWPSTGNRLFGCTVALSADGNTALVGAYADSLGDQGSIGMAYVFTRSGSVWIQQAQLTAADPSLYDGFGVSVALSADGNTALVGAFADDVAGLEDQGSAYIFVRSGETWNQQAHLIASDGAADDSFGERVALSADGNVALVGAAGTDVAGRVDQGSAYIFVRSGVAWSQSVRLIAADGAANDRFGLAISLDAAGSTALVGAYRDDIGSQVNQGSAYVFVRSGALWSQQAKLIALDGSAGQGLGVSAALSPDGSTALLGAYWDDINGQVNQGSAYVFIHSGAAWSQQAKLIAMNGSAQDYFGAAVALSADGSTALVGANVNGVDSPDKPGSAYVFTRSGAAWSQQARLAASDGVANDVFGCSTALSSDGNTALVGAVYGNAKGLLDYGAAYLMARSGASWSQQAKLPPALGSANSRFGGSVALNADGNTALVGSPDDTINGRAEQGSAHVFAHIGGRWRPQGRLTASDGEAGDLFGYSVALSADGNTALVGAYRDDCDSQANKGSAYVFVRNGTQWSQQARLTVSGGMADDMLGYAVALRADGSQALVSAIGEEVAGKADQGVAYVFMRSGESWSQYYWLAASDGEAGDAFGSAVSLSADGNVILVGACGDDVDGQTGQGSAYIYTRSGGNWVLQSHTTGLNGAAGDQFGWSAALSADGYTAVVGAPGDDAGNQADQGSVDVFLHSGWFWPRQAQLASADGAAGDNFGASVAVDAAGKTILVGAGSDDIGSQVGQGSAYLYLFNGLAWDQRQKLTAADGAPGDWFGWSAALAGDGVSLLVGAPDDDVGAIVDHGTAYHFYRLSVLYLPLVRKN